MESKCWKGQAKDDRMDWEDITGSFEVCVCVCACVYMWLCGVSEDWGDLPPVLRKAAKLAVCRRGNPSAWSACLGPQSGCVRRQVIEFNRTWPCTVHKAM